MGKDDWDRFGVAAQKITALDTSIARANLLFSTPTYISRFEEEQKRMADIFRATSFSFDGPVQRAAQKMQEDISFLTRHENQVGSTLSRSMALIEKDAMRVKDLLSAFNASQPFVGAIDMEGIIGRTAARSLHVESFKAIDESMSRMGSVLNASHMLPSETVLSISSQMSKLIDPVYLSGGVGLTWEEALASKLGKFNLGWALDERLGASILGFGRISRIADGIQHGHPYDRDFSDIVNDEIGLPIEFDDSLVADTEISALESGLNAELISFEANSYKHVVLAAGFEILLPPPLVPMAVEGSIGEATFDPSHGHLLSQTEQHLRRTIEERLAAIEGPQWLKRRVPDAMRRRWAERQEEERSTGRPVYREIQYADFMDLADIICQRNNWKDAFHELFVSAEDFKISLQRLHPVRKCLAHSRPLSRYDVLTLVSETSRVLKCLGITVM